MNCSSESHRLHTASKTVPGGEHAPDEAFIEIKGREGSKTIFRKRIAFLEDIIDAEIQKLLGIAQRLPAVAFDALFNPGTIELMLNPDWKIWHEKLGEKMVHICAMRESLVSQHPFAPRDIEPDIALAVNVIVNIVKSGTERKIREIVAVREYDPAHRQNNGYLLEVL